MFTWVMVTIVWSSVVATFDLGGLILPDVAVAISIWGGLRTWRRQDDLVLAFSVGIVSGLFTVDPWFLQPLLCLVAAILSAGLRSRVAPQSFLGRTLVIAAVYAGLAVVEYAIRMSVPSLNLSGSGVLHIACRMMGGIPLTILLDKGTPGRR